MNVTGNPFVRKPLELTRDQLQFRQYDEFGKAQSADLNYEESLVQLESRAVREDGVSQQSLARIAVVGNDPRVKALVDVATLAIDHEHGDVLTDAVLLKLSGRISGGVVANLGQVGLDILPKNPQAAQLLLSGIEDVSDDQGVKALMKSALGATGAARVSSLHNALEIAAAGVGGEIGPTLFFAATRATTPQSMSHFGSDWAKSEQRDMLGQILLHGADHADGLLALAQADGLTTDEQLEAVGLALVSDGEDYRTADVLFGDLARFSQEPVLRDNFVLASQKKEHEALKKAARATLLARGQTPEEVLAALPTLQPSAPLMVETEKEDQPTISLPTGEAVSKAQHSPAPGTPLSDAARTAVEKLLRHATPQRDFSTLEALPEFSDQLPLFLTAPESVLGTHAILESLRRDGLSASTTIGIAKAGMHLSSRDTENLKQFGQSIQKYSPAPPEKALVDEAMLVGRGECLKAAFEVIALGRYLEPEQIQEAQLESAQRVVGSPEGRLVFLNAYAKNSSKLEQAAIGVAAHSPAFSQELVQVLKAGNLSELGEEHLHLTHHLMSMIAETEFPQTASESLKAVFKEVHQGTHGLTDSVLMNHAGQADRISVYRETARELLTAR